MINLLITYIIGNTVQRNKTDIATSKLWTKRNFKNTRTIADFWLLR